LTIQIASFESLKLAVRLTIRSSRHRFTAANFFGILRSLVAAVQRCGLTQVLGVMGQTSSPSTLKTDLAVLGLLTAFVVAAFVFRDGLGILVFAALVLALLTQLLRVAVWRGRTETLKKLWGAVKDAFWGIG